MEIRLIEPESRFADSYREAASEYRAAGIEDYAFTDLEWPALSEKFSNSKLGIRLKPGRVPATYFWLVSETEFIGEIVIRHALNEALLRYGGHVGYGVSRKFWRRGYGTRMLRLALDEARRMRLERVLITCDDNNAASAGVIEKNGGRLQDRISNHVGDTEVITRRYWIEL